MSDIFNYFGRVNFDKKELKDILREICKDYGFSALKRYSVIETGYEDFNVLLETQTNKYVVKFFSNERTKNNIDHYIKMISLIEKQKCLNIPKVYKNKNEILGKVYNGSSEIFFFVMEYINGKTIYDLDQGVDLKTIIRIVFDILKYNCVNTKLRDYLASEEAKKFKQYDMWSYENFLKEFTLKSKYLSNYQKELINPIVNYYEDMLARYTNYDKQFSSKQVTPPYMSAHNDFISTNIILKDNGDPYYIDFSVSSIALNFVDVAIFGCDTVLKASKTPEEYAKYLKIISYILYRTHIMEYNLYPTAVAVQHAIHILIANYYKVHEDVNSEENDYFLNLGIKGIEFLRQANLINKPVFNWLKNGDWYERAELGNISEYSVIKKELKDLGLEDYVESNVKDYLKLYNKNKEDKGYDNIKLDDLYHNGYDWLYSCIDNMQPKQTVMAISFCNNKEWNGSKEENLWTKLNIDALARNVKMKRIFVYPDKNKNLVVNNRDILKFENYKKNNLELGFISLSKCKKITGRDFKLIYPGVLAFDNDIAFIDNEVDPDNRGYSIFDKKKILKYYQIYDLIRQNCD